MATTSCSTPEGRCVFVDSGANDCCRIYGEAGFDFAGINQKFLEASPGEGGAQSTSGNQERLWLRFFTGEAEEFPELGPTPQVVCDPLYEQGRVWLGVEEELLGMRVPLESAPNFSRCLALGCGDGWGPSRKTPPLASPREVQNPVVTIIRGQ